MKLSTAQVSSIIAFVVLFSVLYFGCNTKSKEQSDLVKTRQQNLELINVERIIDEKKKELSGQSLVILSEMESNLAAAEVDSTRITLLKSMASFWYKEEQPLISGYYAGKIAESLESDEQAWSICGTTFAIASKRSDYELVQKHAIKKSRQAYENAISINPENVDHRINLALSYVDFPLEDNPMKGILMLVELNKEDPDNTAVLFQLGRLALGTNQLDKAVERLERVVELEPDNKQAHCLLAEVYMKKGDETKAEKNSEICNS